MLLGNTVFFFGHFWLDDREHAIMSLNRRRGCISFAFSVFPIFPFFQFFRFFGFGPPDGFPFSHTENLKTSMEGGRRPIQMYGLVARATFFSNLGQFQQWADCLCGLAIYQCIGLTRTGRGFTERPESTRYCPSWNIGRSIAQDGISGRPEEWREDRRRARGNTELHPSTSVNNLRPPSMVGRFKKKFTTSYSRPGENLFMMSGAKPGPSQAMGGWYTKEEVQ